MCVCAPLKENKHYINIDKFHATKKKKKKKKTDNQKDKTKTKRRRKVNMVRAALMYSYLSRQRIKCSNIGSFVVSSSRAMISTVESHSLRVMELKETLVLKEYD